MKKEANLKWGVFALAGLIMAWAIAVVASFAIGGNVIAIVLLGVGPVILIGMVTATKQNGHGHHAGHDGGRGGLRQRVANWLLDGVRVDSDVRFIQAKFGEHSVTLSDNITMASSGAPSGAGEMGYIAGDLKWYDTALRVGVSVDKAQTLTSKTLTTPTIADLTNATHDHSNAAGGANLDDNALTSGTFASITGIGSQSQDLVMNSNKITGLAAPTLSDDAARLQDVLGLATQEPVTVVADSALPAYVQAGAGVGATLVASSVGILTIDSVNTVLGDRILVAGEGATHSDHGIYEVTIAGTAGVAFELTRATDYDGSTGNEIASGDLIIIKEGTNKSETLWMLATDETIVVDTTAFAFSEIGVAITAHSGLTGLTSGDDHTQYALLAGRTGGQSFQGGDDAGVDLTLESTAHGTKGNIVMASGSNMQMAGDDDFVPGTTNTGEIGTDALKFKRIRATTIVSGDHDFIDEEKGAHWTFSEEPDMMVATNRITGERFKIGMEPLPA